MNALFTGIYNLFIADTDHAFYTGLGGRFYHVKAPQVATFPYSVFDMITAVNDLYFADEHDIFQIQIDIFTEDNSAAAAGILLAAMKTMFDDCTLAVDGWRFLYMTRDFVVPNNTLVRADGASRIPPIMGYSTQYEVGLEKARS